ncbi:MAG: penicillin-binding protein 2 [bacterium]|nr:penicillin-binding protein 2 [bacterium]
MALKPADAELRLHRGVLIAIVATMPLLAALWGFADQQRGAPNWPADLVDATPRGRIVSRDGQVLADGPVQARRYPQGTLAGPLIGFTGAIQPDGRHGLEGLEHTLDTRLQSGENVVLTIDATLQAAAESRLAETVATYEARSATAVILEVGTGRVLAAASWPTYDPNDKGASDRAAIRNRPLVQVYEPGSVMKPFLVAGLLESGRLDPDEMIESPMTLRVGWKTFRDVAQHEPLLSVADVLRYSSNTGTIALGQRFESAELHAWLAAFGFGQELAQRLAFAARGALTDPARWVPQDHATIAIGQGVATTNLQLAAAYAVIAQDGVYVAPRLVEDERLPADYRVLSPETALAVRHMMQYTVEAGSLRQSAVPGVPTAGKTGTADVYDADLQAYVAGRYAVTFAGMFPVERPEVVMVVTVHEPTTVTSSTLVAAPLFRAISAEVVARWAVAPDAPAWARAAVR